MKRENVNGIGIAVVLTLLAAAFPQNLRGQGYVFFDGGGGGPAQAGSGGIESGRFFPRENPRYLLGGAFSVIGNGYTEQPTTPFFKTNVRNEEELSVAGGIRLARGVYVVGTGGIADRSRRDYLVAGSNSDLLGEYDGTVRGCGSGQLRFVYKRVMFGVGYHSRRGMVAGVGFTFSSLRPGRK